MPAMLVAALAGLLAATDSGDVAAVKVADGLTRPVLATHAPGDSTRLFIAEKQGRVRVLNLKTGVLQAGDDAFLDVTGLVGGGAGLMDERGFLGLAFHPEYATNRQLFACFTDASSSTTIVRFLRDPDDPDQALEGTATTVLTIVQPQLNHNGGWIAFGPNDGHLYVSTGDGGNFCDTGAGHADGGNGQSLLTLLGKILRLDVDALPYAIPKDNPFAGDPDARDEIWAYGLRNAWRNAFDRATGDLWIADIGQDAWEEINVQPADDPGGANYGWRCMEGPACSSDSGCATTGCTCGAPELEMPVKSYAHGSAPSCSGSVTGGAVYRGCHVPELDGLFLYADYCSGVVAALRVEGGMVTEELDLTAALDPPGPDAIGSIVSFGEDDRGEVYLCDHVDGEIFRIVPASGMPTFSDLDCDGAVTIIEVLRVLVDWGPCVGCLADVDGDDEVTIMDLLVVLADWT